MSVESQTEFSPSLAALPISHQTVHACRCIGKVRAGRLFYIYILSIYRLENGFATGDGSSKRKE